MHMHLHRKEGAHESEMQLTAKHALASGVYLTTHKYGTTKNRVTSLLLYLTNPHCAAASELRSSEEATMTRLLIA